MRSCSLENETTLLSIQNHTFILSSVDRVYWHIQASQKINRLVSSGFDLESEHKRLLILLSSFQAELTVSSPIIGCCNPRSGQHHPTDRYLPRLVSRPVRHHLRHPLRYPLRKSLR